MPPEKFHGPGNLLWAGYNGVNRLVPTLGLRLPGGTRAPDSGTFSLVGAYLILSCATSAGFAVLSPGRGGAKGASCRGWKPGSAES